MVGRTRLLRAHSGPLVGVLILDYGATDVSTIKAQTLPRSRALATGEIAALMSSCNRDGSPAGARDTALVAMLYGTGLRRSEAVSIDSADYNVETGELSIRGAKGRKDRLGYATNGSADA